MADGDRGAPAGEVHDWFRRSRELLDRGDAGASLILIDRVLDADPTSWAAIEIRARALFDSQEFEQAAEEFERITQARPDDDYAHYGLGMSLWRLQRFPESADHLALASVMKPHNERYTRALTQVRATLKARDEADLPLSGPIAPTDDTEQAPINPIVPGTLIDDVWPPREDDAG